MAAQWVFGPADGALGVRTGVGGPAGRMGHRLTLAVTTWQARVSVGDDDVPVALSLTAELDSLTVDSGEGGVTPLTKPERATARSNALKTLNVRRFPTVTFDSAVIIATETGYRLTGTLSLHGRSLDHTVDVDVVKHGERWRLSSESEVRQSDYGIKPFSMMMGALRVADTVTVTFEATHPVQSA